VRVQALRLFLESLAENLRPQLAGSNVAQFVNAVLLQSRYLHIPSNITRPDAAVDMNGAAAAAAAPGAAGGVGGAGAAPAADAPAPPGVTSDTPAYVRDAFADRSWHPRVYCHDDTQQAVVLAESRDAMVATLKRLKSIFESIHAIGGRARFDNYLADYFEVVANEIVGAQRVKDFFLDFTYC
jgi:hypothetical protein